VTCIYRFEEKTLKDEGASNGPFHRYVPDLKAVRKNLPRIDKSQVPQGVWRI